MKRFSDLNRGVSMGVAIQIDNVIKRYGDHTVINGLSLDS